MHRPSRRLVQNQQGMASIVIVSTLVILLALITLGFARLMNRALGNTVDNQLGSGAYYAARSGIDDAIAYLAGYPGTSATKCDELLGDGPPPKPLQPAADLLSTATNGVTQYTCILINQNPEALIYQKVDPFKSQVITVRSPVVNLFGVGLSWQSTDRDNSTFNCVFPVLYSQTEWATKKCEPMLRVTVYPVDSDTDSLSTIEANAKTFFFYPVATGNRNYNISTAINGSLREAPCDNIPPGIGNRCYVGLTTNRSYLYYIIRVTPLYHQTDLHIQGVGPGATAEPLIGQAIIDVTAKSNNSVRRLQASVDLGSISGVSSNISAGDDDMPENAVRSAGTICKRLQVFPAVPRTDPGPAYCGLIFN